MDIQHVVVLMLENNSFDRMLGAIPGVDGVDPAHPRTNPHLDGTPVPEARTVMRRLLCNPADDSSTPVDPKHDVPDVLEQLNGPNQGFVQNFQRNNSGCTPDCWAEVMKFYGLGSLPVLHKLAQSFAVCDRWFSSLPGPTWPNRFFVHSGTSLGHIDMPDGIFHPAIHLYDQDTVYDRLGAVNKSWAIYFGDVPQTLTMTHMLTHPFNFHIMAEFFSDAAGPEPDFPAYAFIEPAYFGLEQNDQHPPSDVLRGEVLIAKVYNAIRANQALWEKTLLVILYDEHGGFYDHVSPPACVPPDNNVNDGFNFARLGVRVPAILVSPWLQPQVIHDDFDHTSLLKFLTDKWGLGPLGARTQAAQSFAANWQTTATARTDTPANIPEPDSLPNLEDQPLNPNQLALVGFSRFLETKNVDLAAQQGPAAARAMTLKVGERVIQSTREDTHGEVAVERVQQFLALARQATPPPAGVAARAAKAPAKQAKKPPVKRTKKGVPGKKTTKKPFAKKAAKKAAAKRAPHKAAKRAVSSKKSTAKRRR
jgi:phospholipase C